MKDTEARADIRKLEGITIRLEDEILKLKIKGHETVIRYCSVCKHDTIQKEERCWRYPISSTSCATLYLGGHKVEPDETSWRDYYCLTCGTKFKCTTKEVCEPCGK
jgi:hypothetical protein